METLWAFFNQHSNWICRPGLTRPIPSRSTCFATFCPAAVETGTRTHQPATATLAVAASVFFHPRSAKEIRYCPFKGAITHTTDLLYPTAPGCFLTRWLCRATMLLRENLFRTFSIFPDQLMRSSSLYYLVSPATTLLNFRQELRIITASHEIVQRGKIYLHVRRNTINPNACLRCP